MEGMEVISSEVMDRVIADREAYDPSYYTAAHVQSALGREHCTQEDFAALLAPAAEPFLEEMAQKAKTETAKHFGSSIYPVSYTHLILRSGQSFFISRSKWANPPPP